MNNRMHNFMEQGANADALMERVYAKLFEMERQGIVRIFQDSIEVLDQKRYFAEMGVWPPKEIKR